MQVLADRYDLAGALPGPVLARRQKVRHGPAQQCLPDGVEGDRLCGGGAAAGAGEDLAGPPQTTTGSYVRQVGIADPGDTGAVVLETNGAAVDMPARSVAAVANPAGFIKARIDSDRAESIAPFIYPNTSFDCLSYDPRLELAADGRPVETFGVGPTITYTSPTANPAAR